MVYFEVSPKNRVYPPLPLEVRLKLWLERIDRNTRRFKRPRPLFIRQCFVEALGLPDNRVELDDAGNLTSGSRVIAKLLA